MKKLHNILSILKHSILLEHEWDEKDPYTQYCKHCNAVRKLVIVNRSEWVIMNPDDIKVKEDPNKKDEYK